MAKDTAKVRLFVEDDLGAGAEVALAPGQVRYLAAVLRLGPGAEIGLFNGRDGEWRARIAALARGRGRAEVLRRTRPQAPGADLWLVFAPIKRARLATLAEKATELGVSALVPVTTRRTVVGRPNLARLRARAVEAAEQCGRLTVPDVRQPVPLEALVADWPAGRRLLLCDETGSGRPILDALAEGGPAAPAAVLVGPEGGFEANELDFLKKLPFVTAVGLGPCTLRAETAVLAALACWQAFVDSN